MHGLDSHLSRRMQGREGVSRELLLCIAVQQLSTRDSILLLRIDFGIDIHLSMQVELLCAHREFDCYHHCSFG